MFIVAFSDLMSVSLSTELVKSYTHDTNTVKPELFTALVFSFGIKW